MKVFYGKWHPDYGTTGELKRFRINKDKDLKKGLELAESRTMSIW